MNIKDKVVYFILLLLIGGAIYLKFENDKIIGSAGIAPLAGEKEHICELQKMYFSAEARGRGLGSKMMNVCLAFAKEQGFTQLYHLEGDFLKWQQAELPLINQQ